jgi:hypothetical protein
MATIDRGRLQFVGDPARIEGRPDTRIISLIPPETLEKIRLENEAAHLARAEARATRRGEVAGIGDPPAPAGAAG